MEETTLAYAADGDPAPALVGAKIGRYQLLELVGSGGMGMVWGAWDPELERRVALKLVRIVGEGARERMLREGQVLARLSHPNVVPIYDVGVMGAQVYLVMEWVRGETLREFADGKPTERALVDAYRQAGAGLAAAHEAGVVHRDFKPANVIRGDDGRVRVLDFGIAADEASREVPAAGTPRYMAPEQRAGDIATTASDQYAFCISLLEAFGPDATPGWIGAIVERGTDPDPTKRFASMEALLDELARDPARRRRRAAMGVILVGAAVGAFAIGRSGADDGPAIRPCSGAATELATSWNPAVRDRVASHLASLGPVAGKLPEALDAYGRDWIATHERTCRANERKELPPALYTTRLDCLARTRYQLAAVADLMTSVSAEALPEAVRAARSLPDVKGCADITNAIAPAPAAMTDAVQAVVPEVERALVLATAKRPDAAAAAREATAKARTTGYDPLIARALLAQGRAITVDTREDARDAFAEALRRALRVTDDVLAVEAYARWVFELVRKGESTIESWDVMLEVAERLGRNGRFVRALLYNNRAVGFLVVNDLANARVLFERARDAAGDLEDLELLVIRVYLASLEQDGDTYATALRSIHDRLGRALGPDHPDVLVQALNLALLEHDREKARTAMRDTCTGYMRWQQLEAARLCSFEAAMLAIDADDREQASALMSNVVAMSRTFELRDELIAWLSGIPSGRVDIRAEIAAAYIASESDRATAIAALERAIAEQGSTSWQRMEVVDAMIVLGRWQQADELFRTVAQPVYARRAAQIQRGLAVALATTAPDRARDAATRARAYYAQDPSATTTVAALDAILTAAAR